ncbi:hypothetical protein EVB91_098 [Rhizobium phage RHph_I1_18]|nr:hypothetical protein EVB91_098 [Rhizobium phage RHph_I1_18]
MDLPRVIFVDIDGPMIPGGMYLRSMGASYERLFASHCVDALNAFCERTSAKIVFNSYHNYQTTCDRIGDDFVNNGENLRKAAVRNGIISDHIHTDWRTEYASPETRKLSGVTLGRYDAIQRWLTAHPDTTDWIAIDDADFRAYAGDKQILIDFDYGFTIKEMNVALAKFNAKPFLTF